MGRTVDERTKSRREVPSPTTAGHPSRSLQRTEMAQSHLTVGAKREKEIITIETKNRGLKKGTIMMKKRSSLRGQG